MAGNKGLK